MMVPVEVIFVAALSLRRRVSKRLSKMGQPDDVAHAK